MESQGEPRLHPTPSTVEMAAVQNDDRTVNGFQPTAMPTRKERGPVKPGPKKDRVLKQSSADAMGQGETQTREIPTFDLYTSEPGGVQSKAQAELGPEMYAPGAKCYPRISKPVELLRSEYDVVVIGSGYGGGVAASRMARAGQSVCLLELGKEKWPGEYPSSMAEALPELHVSGETALGPLMGKRVDIGSRTGLYHLVVGEGQNAFVGNGLGGTSLLNANVCLRADEKSLQSGSWPSEIRKIPGALDKYYERVESVLEPAPYPEHYPDLPKLSLLKRQAEALGRRSSFSRVPQTTRFENGPNSTGVEMQASSLTGMDATGVNDGSKSSTLVNYLSDAWNWGAEIFCECEVRHVKKDVTGQGYTVHFAWHGAKREAFASNLHQDLMWVKAKKFVFLGAGAIGTAEILLRCRQMGLSLSKTLATGMSGNGDILAFGYNTDYDVNGVGKSHPNPERPIGPCITGVIDCRDTDPTNFLDGYVIEEGTVPEPLAASLWLMLESLPGSIRPPYDGLLRRLRRLAARRLSLFLGPYARGGSVQRTQTYLVMSHDSNQATMTLEDDKPLLKFLGVGRSDHVNTINGILAKATAAVGGTFVQSPFYAAFGQKEITVHPIGGANMSSDGTGALGVTNHLGEVFSGNGTDIHHGLVCVDASVIPTALGVNPFATLTALAERSVEGVARKSDIEIDYDTRNGRLNLFGGPAHPLPKDGALEQATKTVEDARAALRDGLGFSEIMEGFIYLGSDIEDFDIAERVARGACNAARFFLSVHAWDTEALVSHEAHGAMLTGTFTCGALSRDPMMVLQGAFRLFNEDPRLPDTTNLTYDFDMKATDGRTIRFNGYKVVNAGAAFWIPDVWRATSTLYVTLTRPEDGSVVGRGVLRIKPRAFVSELATFSPSGADWVARARAATQFLTFFSKRVAGVLFAPFRSLQWPTVAAMGFYNKELPAHTFKITARDGVQTTMQMWEAGRPRTETPHPNVLLVPGAAVDHQIFALPTIEQNAVEYFQRAGYRLYCITHRIGKTIVAQQGHTTYDARLDIEAALGEIRRQQGSDEKIYVVAHCAGSVSLSMGLLDGTIPAKWIKGITASNVFMNPVFGKVNYRIARLPLSMTDVYRTVIGNWFSCASSPQDAYLQQALNQATRFYPVGGKDEICNSVTCHRSELVFGRLWTHKKLNEATHANLSKFLGGVSMPCLEHLMDMGIAMDAIDNDREGLVTSHNVARLAGIPILLFSGSENVVFTPESTYKSYSELRHQLGADDYERVVFSGRGHLDCWMGADAYKDVYPRVAQHIKKTISLGRRNE